MKTILITGVAGLLGSRLADWLCKNTDYKIVGVDDLSGGYLKNIPTEVQFERTDLVKEFSYLESIFDEYKPTFVFHFAAYAAEGLSPFIRRYNYDNNLKATVGIVNLCVKYDVKRLIFTSSMAVYGHGYNDIFDENQIPNPIDPYGIAKYACEMDIKVAGEQHGLDWCIIRPHNVYGPNQNIWDRYRNVLGIWMYQHLNNKPMTIYGAGDQTRAFSYIDDSLGSLWNAAIKKEASKEIINLGGIKEYSIKEANNILKEVIGSGEVVFLEARHEVKRAVPTYSKSVEILGFEHKTDLKEGLGYMWEWAKTQPKREQKSWSEYELDRGIYSYWK
jgi:UDP-glucose 4-epimerase